MNTQSILRIMFLSLVIVVGGLCPALAHEEQGGPGPGQGPGGGPGRFGNGLDAVLTPDEKQQMMKAHEQAVANDPSLKTEMDALQKKRQEMTNGSAPDEATKREMMQAFKAHEEKMRAAMLKADPTIAPLFAKIDKKKQEMKARIMQKQQGGNSPQQN